VGSCPGKKTAQRFYENSFSTLTPGKGTARYSGDCPVTRISWTMFQAASGFAIRGVNEGQDGKPPVRLRHVGRVGRCHKSSARATFNRGSAREGPPQ